MSKGSRTDLCGGWPERAIPTATGGGGRPNNVHNSNYFPTPRPSPRISAPLTLASSYLHPLTPDSQLTAAWWGLK